MESELKKELMNMNDIDNHIMSSDFQSYYQCFISELQISGNSFETYSKCLKQFFKYLEEQSIQRPTRQDIKNYILYLKANGKSVATINLYLVSVRRLFMFLEENGLYYDIARGIKTENAKYENPSKLPLNEIQSKHLIDSIQGQTLDSKRDKIIIELMLFCGLRCIEIERANKKDFEMIDNQCVMFIQGKGRQTKSEYVKIPNVLYDEIKDYFKQREDSSESAFVSCSHVNYGQRLTTRSISRIAKDHLKENGFESARYTAHALRHTAITIARHNGQSSEEVSQMARHKSIQTTKIYDHYDARLNNNSELIVANAILNA